MRSIPVLVLTLVLGAAACTGDPGNSTAPGDRGTEVAHIDVALAPTVSVLPVGFETRLTAHAWLRNGNPAPNGFIWTVDRPDLASVDSTGLVRALGGQGTVRVSATVDGVSGSVALGVVSLPGRIAVERWSNTHSDGIEVIPMAGGPRTLIANDRPQYRLAFPALSPDGTRLAFACTDDLLENAVCASAADGTGRVRLATSPEVYYFGPAWSPDGLSILYSNDGRLFQTASDGSGSPEEVILPLAAGSTGIGGGRPAPNAPWIVYSSYWDLYDDYYPLCIAGPGQTSATCPTQGLSPAWSPDGTTLVAVTLNDGLALLASNGSGAGTLVPATSVAPGMLGAPAWSPDGEWIAFSVYTPGGSGYSWDLYVVRARDGSNMVKMARDGHDHDHPSWGR